MATTLLSKGDLESAGIVLPIVKEPQSLQEWSAYRIQGLILLKSGKVNQAIEMFENGYKNSPWTRIRSYFATTLGLAKLKSRAFRESLNVLREGLNELEHGQKQTRLLLLAHSSAELGQRNDARRALGQIKLSPKPVVLELRKDLMALHALDKSNLPLRGSNLRTLRRRIEQNEFLLEEAA
jgi:tetratricopeptide (TPR) repeat protein